jgi:transcriptional regulator with XRE-family HTH domain
MSRGGYVINTGFNPELLRGLREEEGWSQTELARRAGVGKAQVCQWEGGRIALSDANLTLLAGALGVSRAMLCDEDAA